MRGRVRTDAGQGEQAGRRLVVRDLRIVQLFEVDRSLGDVGRQLLYPAAPRAGIVDALDLEHQLERNLRAAA